MFTLCCQTAPQIWILVKKAFRLVLRWVQLRLRSRPGSRTTETSLLDENHPSGYEDLLKHLRTVGDLRWTFATHGPSQNPANISPKAAKEGVLKSERIADAITRLTTTETTGTSPPSPPSPPPTEAELKAKVRSILEEMGHSYSIWYIRLLGFILIKAVRKMYEHIWVNVEALRELEPLLSRRDIPVIFMPTHRSYADFLLVSFVAFHYGLPLPTIASGIDFLGMSVVGEILRKAGAFFIRRSFAHDPLYRTVFTEYVQNLLRQPQPLEFFVEGTRSRSGKSLQPKIGLLHAATEIFLRGFVSDVLIVPISITYEKTLEEKLYAKELLGVPKQRESTSALLGAGSNLLKTNFGSLFFHVGKTVSVRDFMTDKVDRSKNNLLPRSQISSREEEILAVKNLAFFVVEKQQENIRIHNWTILATVLLHQLRKGNVKIAVETVLAECQTLDALIQRTSSKKNETKKLKKNETTNLKKNEMTNLKKNDPMLFTKNETTELKKNDSMLFTKNDAMVSIKNETMELKKNEMKWEMNLASLQHCVKIHGDIIELKEEKVNEEKFDKENLYEKKLTEKKFDEKKLNEKHLIVEIRQNFRQDLKISHLLLAHYRNQLLHRVVFSAFRVFSSKIILTSGEDSKKFLQRIFAWEFVSQTEIFDEIFDEKEQKTVCCKKQQDDFLLETLIEPFIVGYAIILRLLLVEDFSSKNNLKTMRILGKEIQKFVGQLLDAEVYSAFEILSLDLITNCIQAVKNLEGLRLEADFSFSVNREILSNLSFQLDLFVPPAILVAVTGAIANLSFHDSQHHSVI